MNKKIFLCAGKILRRKMPVLAVEGIIGAGKSSLLIILQKLLTDKYPNIVIIPEPVEKWKSSGWLQKYYSNQKEHGFKFQSYILQTFVENYAAHYQPDAELHILERSLPSVQATFFALQIESGNFTGAQAQQYMQSHQEAEENVPLNPTHYLYLEPGLEECQRRVQQRSRKEEAQLLQKFQEQLHQKHLEFFERQEKVLKIPILDYQHDQEAQIWLRQQVREFLES